VVLLPDLQNPDLAFPSLAAQLLPVGVQGLVLTALVAAMMSSLDSALNAAATLTTLDFVKPLWPDLGDDALMKMGRGFTGLFMVISAVYAPSIRHFQNLFAYFQSVLAYVVPPIVAVFLLGIFWRRANRHGGFWALVLGVACGVPLFVAKEVTGVWHEVLGLPTVHYTTMATLMFVFGTLVTVGVSLATGPARRDPMADVDWHLAGALSGWADPRVLGGALLAATLALVAVFW
jgi:SSS family solute:Na+ symporter